MVQCQTELDFLRDDKSDDKVAEGMTFRETTLTLSLFLQKSVHIPHLCAILVVEPQLQDLKKATTITIKVFIWQQITTVIFLLENY